MRKIWGKNPKRNIIFVLCISGIILSVQGIFVYIYIKNGTPIKLAFTLSAGFLDIIAIPGSIMGIIDLLKLFRSSDDNKITVNIENQYNGVLPKQIEEETLAKARSRLASLPLDIIPSPSILPKGSHVPDFRSNAKFLGRKEELKQLAGWIKGERPEEVGQLIAITGMGGVGKTQLLVEVIQRYGQFFEGGVFWVDFSQPKLISDQVAAFSKAREGMKQEDKVKDALSDWQGEIPRLLIFDNCESFDLLKRWIPPTGASRVLVSSRNNGLGKELGAQQVPLLPFSQQQSIDLLRLYCPELEINDPDLVKIVEEVGGLPLALHMAGMFLQKYHHEVPPTDYYLELRKTKPLHHRSLVENIFSPTGYKLSVERTISVSYKKLGKGKEDQIAVRLLQRAACFAPGVWIPREILKNSLGENFPAESFTNGLQRLLSLGLVEENETGDVWVHRLVCNFVRNLDKNDKALNDVEKTVIKAANVINKQGFPARMLPLLMHLQFLTDQALLRKDENAANLANVLGNFFQLTGQYEAAQPYFEQALTIRRRVLGEEHISTATSLNNLGVLFKSMGQYEAARLYYEQALAIRRRVLGEEHPDMATSLNNLGVLFYSLGQYEAARPYFEQALKIRWRVLGEEHPDTASSLNNLGGLFDSMGQYEAALPYYEQALAIRRKIMIEEHPDTATSLNNLGGVNYNLGRYEAAQPYYEHSLAIRRKVLGEEHPDTTSSLNNLGSLFQAMGQYEAARPYFEQALVINRKVLGEEHPDTAINLNNLGLLFLSMGQYKTARRYYEQALSINRKMLGEQHPATARNLNNLGGLFYSMGQYEAARPYFEHALAIRRKVLGKEHPDTASSLANLGGLFEAMGQYYAARPYYEQALVILQKTLGEDHPTTKIVQNNLDTLLKEIAELSDNDDKTT